jgi:hypothetical protein
MPGQHPSAGIDEEEQTVTRQPPGQFRCSLPPLLRVAERVGAALRACGVPIARLTEDSILRAARRATGVRDIADERFREPLRMILRGYDRHPNVNLVGKLVVRDFCLCAVTNRLRMQRIVECFPEILAVPVEKPVVVTGLHRTGTTLLHNLLAQAPGARAPLFWEMLTPAPDPGWVGKAPDPRRKFAEAYVRRVHSISPRSRAIHDLEVDAPEECLHLFINSFTSEHFLSFADLPEYREWYESRDMVEEYRYYRLQLQTLLWQRGGGQLVVKWPFHAYHLKALLTVFPDAGVVFTHREPAKSVASMCSLVLMFRLAGNRLIDAPRVGAWCLDFLGKIADRAVSGRRGVDPHRLCDVSYDDLVRDPIGTIRRVGDRFGRPLSPGAEGSAGDWLREHPQNKWGQHRYDLGKFGISAGAVRERFRAYSLELGAASRACIPAVA